MNTSYCRFEEYSGDLMGKDYFPICNTYLIGH